jgi:hypothetical protein
MMKSKGPWASLPLRRAASGSLDRHNIRRTDHHRGWPPNHPRARMRVRGRGAPARAHSHHTAHRLRMPPIHGDDGSAAPPALPSSGGAVVASSDSHIQSVMSRHGAALCRLGRRA